MTKAAGVCDAFCKGCIFSSGINGNKSSMVCDYYEKTGKRRPCSAGTGCTVRQTGKKTSMWREQGEETYQARLKKEKQPKPEREVLHRVCPVCGTEFDTKDSKKIYCCKDCRERAKAEKRVQHNHKECKECGTPFDTTDDRKIYCCRACGNKAKYKAFLLRKQQQEAVEVEM